MAARSDFALAFLLETCFDYYPDLSHLQPDLRFRDSKGPWTWKPGLKRTEWNQQKNLPAFGTCQRMAHGLKQRDLHASGTSATSISAVTIDSGSSRSSVLDNGKSSVERSSRLGRRSNNIDFSEYLARKRRGEESALWTKAVRPPAIRRPAKQTHRGNDIAAYVWSCSELKLFDSACDQYAENQAPKKRKSQNTPHFVMPINCREPP